MDVPNWWLGDVSRETLDKLQAYANLIRKWSPKINLVAKSTLPDLEQRHIWDSAQVFRPHDGLWADFGSGGGLPGVVIAILAQAHGLGTRITLIESDQRKATFLRTCSRELSVPINVVPERIEDVSPLLAETLSARALAPLDDLLAHAERHLAQAGQCYFQNGAQWREEVSLAKQNWRFSCETIQSKTNDEAVILKIKDITRV